MAVTAAASLANAASAVFQLTAAAPANEAGNAISMAVLATSQTLDPDGGNNDAEASVNVTATADLRLTYLPRFITRATPFTFFEFDLFNNGPDASVANTVTIRIDVPNSDIDSVNGWTGGESTASWNCVRAQTPTFEATCTKQQAIGSGVNTRFTLNHLRRITQPKAVITIGAEASSAANDPQPMNNVVAEKLRVVGGRLF